MENVKGIERCEVWGDFLAEMREAEIADMEELASFSVRLNASLPRPALDRTARNVGRMLEMLEKATEAALTPAPQYVPHKYRVRQNRDRK